MSESYRDQLIKLLPPGAAWPRSADGLLAALLDGLAAELDRVDARARKVIDESIARSILETLSDWERVCGLPEACDAGISTTIQERRAAVMSKLNAVGGNSKAYFIGLAATMGYTIEIDEFRPFVTGISRCGQQINSGHAVRHQWRVRVIGPRYTPFRTGVSQCGDSLGKITRADDLECRFKRLKPAHTNLIVSYEGA